MNPDDMTSEQLWALARNPEFLNALSAEDRAEVEALTRDYLRAASAEEFAEAKLDDARREMFRRTVQLVAAVRANPAGLETLGDAPCEAARERIWRLIDDGQEVTDDFVAEICALEERARGPGPAGPRPSPG